MGKGSWRRPPRVSLKQISDNYDQTFGKKDAKRQRKTPRFEDGENGPVLQGKKNKEEEPETGECEISGTTKN